MTTSRREFLKLFSSLVGGWALFTPMPSILRHTARKLVEMSDLISDDSPFNVDVIDTPGGGVSNPSKSSNTSTSVDDENVLDEFGYINPIAPLGFVFDDNKYSPKKPKIMPSDWDTHNRHLPIYIKQHVINKPGERNPEALKRVVAYTPFNSPRYVAAPGERVTMCNIAAWDWSRALQLHLPHWIGDTEMSANMLFRWISHSQAGGIYGEGWQPVPERAVRPLAQIGIPVFALAENPTPGRHGHVAMAYPKYETYVTSKHDPGIYLASVNNGRRGSGNGIKHLRDTFKYLSPTFFVHKHDFIVYRDG